MFEIYRDDLLAARSFWSDFSARPAFKLLLIAALLLALVVLLLRPPEQAAPIGMAVPAAPAPEVRGIIKLATPIKAKSVKAYPASVKKKAGIPEMLKADPAVAVVSAAQVKADDHPQTVTTTLNTDTGEVESYTRRDPLPWLAWDYRGEAGMSLGLKNGETATRLEVRQNLFAVKAVHFGVTGTVDQTLDGGETDSYIGIGAWYRW